MPVPNHTSRVRVLYKTILRLHRGLPAELKVLGDQYAKEEFKRHKSCEPQFIPIFMNEWTNYVQALAKQLGRRSTSQHLGIPLTEQQMDYFSDEQVAQLFELFQETQKPKDHDS